MVSKSLLRMKVRNHHWENPWIFKEDIAYPYRDGVTGYTYIVQYERSGEPKIVGRKTGERHANIGGVDVIKPDVQDFVAPSTKTRLLEDIAKDGWDPRAKRDNRKSASYRIGKNKVSSKY